MAQSICQDILAIDPENQPALIQLILSMTDTFAQSTEVSAKAVFDLIPRLTNEYDRVYYTGVIHERQAKARLNRAYPGSNFDARANPDSYSSSNFDAHANSDSHSSSNCYVSANVGCLSSYLCVLKLFHGFDRSLDSGLSPKHSLIG